MRQIPSSYAGINRVRFRGRWQRQPLSRNGSPREEYDYVRPMQRAQGQSGGFWVFCLISGLRRSSHR